MSVLFELKFYKNLAEFIILKFAKRSWRYVQAMARNYSNDVRASQQRNLNVISEPAGQMLVVI